MGPEIATNIGSMLRALENVVIPAIDPENGLAREQSWLIMMYLRLMAEQHDQIFHFRLREIREFHALASELLRLQPAALPEDEITRSAYTALEAAKPLLALELPHYEALAETARTLRALADALTQRICDNGNAEQRSLIGAMLLDQAKIEALRERSWVAGLGQDPKPEELPPRGQFIECQQTP